MPLRMTFLALRVGLMLASPLFVSPALAQDGPPPLQRSFFRLPAQFDGAVLALEAMEIRPRGAGPFPLALIAHGTPGLQAQRQQYSVDQYATVAADLARRGFAALALLRRGYGSSEGSFAESNGACGRSRYVEAGMESARDLAAAIGFMGMQRHIDRDRVVVIGQSAGGFAALALGASPPPGLVGVIDFAGGRGHFSERNAVCEPEKLVAAVGRFGRTARVPSLWIYAENDRSFPPALARAMHAAYVAGGAPAAFLLTGAFRDDGHRLFIAGIDEWRTPVDDFLRRLGLPTSPPRQPLVPPSGLAEQARKAFAAYGDAPQPNKAFALGPGSAFGWRADAQPIDAVRREALAMCQRSGQRCWVMHEAAELGDE
jgi:dienelactone hydrolase